MATLTLFHRKKGFMEKKNRSEYFASLFNIPGLTYAIGSEFPDEKENFEFIFYEIYGPPEPIQCRISVHDDGRFWISKGSRFSMTFVNWKEVEEPCLLKDDDSISFGFPRKYWEDRDCPIFRVRIKHSDEKKHKETIPDTFDPLIPLRNDPLNNELILFTIFKFLRVRNLKRCRLVSKKWNQEAKKLVQKRGKIRFDFQHDWKIPKNSMRVLKYLHELKHLKLTNLEIALPKSDQSTDTKKKPFGDFVKLLKSENNFRSLTLTSPITDSESFSYLCRLLKSLDKKLVELTFCDKFQFNYLPENVIHPFEVSFKGLRKLSDFGGYGCELDAQTLSTWISSLVPQISQTLESYSCDKYTIHFNLKTILKENKLKHLTINCSFHAQHYQKFFQFNGTLKTLVLQEVIIADQNIANQITKFFERQANHLEMLRVHFHGNNAEVEIFFPPFPKLRELRLQYNSNVRILWVGGETKYKLQFPALKVLKVRKVHDDADFERVYGNGPFEWEKIGSTFNSFFSDYNGTIKSTTITKLVVPSLGNVNAKVSCLHCSEEYRRFHLRILQFPILFPNVKTKPMEGLGLIQRLEDNDSDSDDDVEKDNVASEHSEDYDSNSYPGSPWDLVSNFDTPDSYNDVNSVRSENNDDREEVRSRSNSENSREDNNSPRHISGEDENSGNE